MGGGATTFPVAMGIHHVLMGVSTEIVDLTSSWKRGWHVRLDIIIGTNKARKKLLVGYTVEEPEAREAQASQTSQLNNYFRWAGY